MIIPAILPKNQTELNTKVKQILGFVPCVQVDICDGEFVVSKTGFNELPYMEDIDYELDLMIKNPEKVLHEYIENFQPARIVLHLESIENMGSIMGQIGGIRGIIEIGFCIGNDTDNEVLEQYIDQCDFIQLMGIKTIGKQSEPFDDRVLEKINYFHTKYPELTISIDGSVNQETITKLAHAGASRFVCGSSVFGDKRVGENIEQLEFLLHKISHK
jgi:ribulose-phosphate 3-epimerase